MEKEEYAIVDKDGNFITAPNETGSGKFISVMTKTQAELNIGRYYQSYSAKKVKVK